MKDRLFDRVSVLEVLDDDSLEQRRRDLGVPDAFRIHDDDRSVATHPKTRSFTALDALGAKKQVLALEQIAEQRVELSSATIGRAEVAGAYEHVMRVRLHLRLLPVNHSAKIHMLTRATLAPPWIPPDYARSSPFSGANHGGDNHKQWIRRRSGHRRQGLRAP